MKRHSKLLFVFLGFISLQGVAQVNNDISGAWHSQEGGQKDVVLFQDGYVTHTVFSANEFLFSHGGPYKISGNQIDVLVEYNSQNADQVGTHLILSYEFKDDQLILVMDDERFVWNRLDNSTAPLAGVWQITDRVQEGNLVPIQRSGTRKTLKILTGSRFQWFAIDPATKLFAGTGGGTYTFVDGKYTENIDFFSRDNSRVGAALTFDGKLEEGKWHHSGLSSKGDKIYEVWGRTPY